jgi:hypothetical protein
MTVQDLPGDQDLSGDGAFMFGVEAASLHDSGNESSGGSRSSLSHPPMRTHLPTIGCHVPPLLNKVWQNPDESWTYPSSIFVLLNKARLWSIQEYIQCRCSLVKKYTQSKFIQSTRDKI